MIYYLVAHRKSGEVFALEINDKEGTDVERITGVAGPLHYSEWQDPESEQPRLGWPLMMEYESDKDDLKWAANEADWQVIERREDAW